MIILLIYLILNIVLCIHFIQHKEEYNGRLMIAFLIPLAVAAASSIYQGIKGAQQKKKARQMQAEADQLEQGNLADARRMALTGMPEAEYQRALQNIYRNQAAGLAALRDRRSALAGVPALQQSTNDALLNLAAQDAEMRRQGERTALGQANRYSGLRGELAARERAGGEALTGAALQNLYNTGMTAAGIYGGGGNINGGMGSGNSMVAGMSPNYDTSLWGSKGYRGLTGYSKPY